MKTSRENNRLPRCKPIVSLSRALSKMGYCSRTKAQALIQAGRIRINGIVQNKVATRVDLDRDQIEVDGHLITSAPKIYLMLNKPRGLVTTAADEHGRNSVYQCLVGEKLPWIFPVGRLDKASEGLLLFTNDTRWAAQILAPEHHLDKIYHVQIDQIAEEALLQRISEGVTTTGGDLLTAKQSKLLRQGSRHSWLEIVIDEGKNRHIRRLVAGLGINVLRLVRVAIGQLQLGNLPKGEYRHLYEMEVKSLSIP